VNAIACEALTLGYGRRAVVREATLGVPAGSFMALLGRNGAGKSTLVRGLLGLQPALGGSARILGLEPWRDRAVLMERLGLVPETPDAPPALSLDRISAFCGRLRRTWDAAGVRARLVRMGVDPSRPFGELSRGQRTQGALALALGGNPEVLVLDDPTQGLDPVARRSFFQEVLGDLADRGTTVLMATHDLDGVEALADRIAVLDGGRIHAEASLEDLKARFRRVCGPARMDAALLAPFRPVALEAGPLGLEATLTAYSPEAWAAAGLDPAWVAGADLETIFLALVEGGVA
jgi:ABC-2 type transport system ATP-binding protein